MNDPLHTPAPWVAEVVGRTGGEISEVALHSTPAGRIFAVLHWADGIDPADVALVAAAPLLLAACRQLLANDVLLSNTIPHGSARTAWHFARELAAEAVAAAEWKGGGS